MGIFLLIHESHIAEHGEISNTSPIASSRPIGLVHLLSEQDQRYRLYELKSRGKNTCFMILEKCLFYD